MTSDRTGGGGFEGLLDLLTGPLCSQRERDPESTPTRPTTNYIYWSN
jgi:hypothetical protein